MLVDLSAKTREQIEDSLELLIRLKTQMLDSDERANRQACAAGQREDIAKAKEALAEMMAAPYGDHYTKARIKKFKN